MDTPNLSSNWKRLQATLKRSETSQSSLKTSQQNGLKRKRQTIATQSPGRGSAPKRKPLTSKVMAQDRSYPKKIGLVADVETGASAERPGVTNAAATDSVNAGLSASSEIGRYIALDCEMVGVGPNPDRESALARVSIVNYNGDQVYDSYVMPLETVTDWRTHVSGIAPKHMKAARSLKEAQADVSKILKDRILIGHAIRHDLEALMLSHPKRDIRDTARHPPYRKIAGGSSPRLKILASELLGFEIQDGEHSSVEDARACMLLFRKDKAAFEREHSKAWPVRPTVGSTENNKNPTSTPKKKKKKKKKK